jgi:hypothetical protein
MPSPTKLLAFLTAGVLGSTTARDHGNSTVSVNAFHGHASAANDVFRATTQLANFLHKNPFSVLIAECVHCSSFL